MDGLHDIILIAIIGAIILVQVFVFFGNYRKIQDYKKTIEKANDFKIVEVAVPEELIKEVEVDDILRNPEAFQGISTEFSSKMTEAPEENIEPYENHQAYEEQEKLLETQEEFPEELEFPDASDLDDEDEENFIEDEEDFDDFEYEEYKNNKR